MIKTFFPAKVFSRSTMYKITSSKSSGSGIFPIPLVPQANRPSAGVRTCIPRLAHLERLIWVMGFKYIWVFMAGAKTMGASQAKAVVVSISSAKPFANFAMTFAEVGAIIIRSAASAKDTCSTWNSKFRSKVSTRHLCPVSVSKVMGLIKLVAFFVIIT